MSRWGAEVDIARRSLKVHEQRARRTASEHRESRLVERLHSVGHPSDGFPPRTSTALAKRPIEQYADRAAVGSLGAVAAALGTNDSDSRRAAKLILAEIPKVATIGRAFATHFDRVMS